VICFIIYFVLGFFGAARWGLATNGNLLVNAWGPPAYQGVLNILLGGEWGPLSQPSSPACLLSWARTFRSALVPIVFAC
jgi:hypothetical protein